MSPPAPFRYSTLQDAHKCLRYYELKHLLGLDDGSSKNADLAFGTAVHTGIQDLFEIGSGVDAFESEWAEKEDAGLEYGRHQWADLMKLGKELITIFADEQMKHFEPLHLEKKLTAPLGAHMLSGTVDFLGYYKKVRSVVDWKTSAMPYDRYKLIVNEQTYGYTHLAKLALGFEAAQRIYAVAIKDTKNPRWQIRVEPVTAAGQAAAMANVEAMCNRVAETKVFVKNPVSCVVGKRICPFYEKCHGGGGSGGANGGEEET